MIWWITFLRYFLIYVLSIDRWCNWKNHMGNPDGWIVTLMNSRCCIDGNDKWRWVIDISDKKKKLGKQTRRDEKNPFYLRLVQDGAIKSDDSAYLFIGTKSSRSDQLLMERFNKCFLIYIHGSPRKIHLEENKVC